MIVYNNFKDLYQDIYILYSCSDDVPSMVITYDMADDIAVVENKLVDMLGITLGDYSRVTDRDEFVYEVMAEHGMQMETYVKTMPPQTKVVTHWRKTK